MKPTVATHAFNSRAVRAGGALLSAAALLLAAGCAGMQTVDVDVTSFASWPGGTPAAAGSTYRFERLPSQQQSAVQRDRLETFARDALARKGLQPTPALAQYSVQISTNTQLVSDGYATAPYGGPNVGISTGIFSGSGGGGFGGISFGFPLGGNSTGSTGYRVELVMLLRSLQTNTVVYESRAYAVTPSSEDPAVLAAMVDSALRGFPVPLTGPQRYKINLSSTRP